MTPYYSDGSCVIYHGGSREILPTLPKCDLICTDPPYAEATHIGQRSHNYSSGRNGGSCVIDFESIDAAYLRDILTSCAPRRWVISFIDWRHALPLESKPPNGLEFIRLGIWWKTNPTPQFTGDRPGTGWEAIAFLHPPGRKQWNGGGLPAIFSAGCARSENEKQLGLHPTEKPLSLIKHLLSLFSLTGESVLDPFMGSGTTLVAAKQMGLSATGIELEERYCEIAANRLRQAVFDFGPIETPKREEPTLNLGAE